MNSKGYSDSILVSGYFSRRKSVSTYTFYNYKTRTNFQTECNFVITVLWKKYILQVSYENDLKDYRVVTIIEECTRTWSQEVSYALCKDPTVVISSPENYVNSCPPGYNDWVHCKATRELSRLLNIVEGTRPQYRLIEYFRKELWEKLVYDSQPYHVQPDVLAEWLSLDHPLVHEARVYKEMIVLTKQERCVWLDEDQFNRKVARFRGFEITRDRMFRKSVLVRNTVNGKLALNWAASQTRQFRRTNGYARFIDAPWGRAQEVCVTFPELATRQEFFGNRMASVDLFVDRKQVTVTMCNDRNWERAPDPTVLKMRSPPNDSRSILSMPHLRIGLACSATEDAITTTLRFLRLRNVGKVVFAFAYEADFQRRECERYYPRGLRVCLQRRESRFCSTGLERQSRVLFVEKNSQTAYDAATNEKEDGFSVTDSHSLLQTCREDDLTSLKSETFEAVVLFVQMQTHYRWIIEADRVAGDRLLIVVDTDVRPASAIVDSVTATSAQPMSTLSPTSTSTTNEVGSATSTHGQVTEYSSSCPPTVREIMSDVYNTTHSHSTERTSPKPSTRKRVRLERQHEIVFERTFLPDDHSLESLIVFFESKVTPGNWTRLPHYAFNKGNTIFHCYCAGRCGSKKFHKPVYSVMLEDGMIVKYTDMAENTSHGVKCL